MRAGTVLGTPPRHTQEVASPMPFQAICSVTNCNRKHYARQMCAAHYLQAWRRAELPPLYRPGDQERFWSKVRKTDTCWLWMGASDRRGYGRLTLDRKTRRAYRVAYEWVRGPVPEGLELDHLCRTPACVRPDHLEPVTHGENIRRATVTTHCIQGHQKYIDRKGRSRCRECDRTHNERTAARRRAMRPRPQTGGC